MSDKENYEKLRISTGGIIAPLITLALLIVFWRLGQKWIVAPVIVFLLFFYLLLPWIVRGKAKAFHREALQLLATGKSAAVPDLAKKQLILQLFGPTGPIDAKLGLAYSQIGDHEQAQHCHHTAIPGAPASPRPALQAALTKALFVNGDLARAEAEGRTLLRSGLELPEIMVLVARSRVGLNKVDADTFDYLDKAESSSPSGDVQLMIDLTRIEAALATGRKPRDVPDGADSTQRFIRTWIHLVRGLLREKRGDPRAAARSYAKAVREGKEDGCWFANAAHGRIEHLGLAVGLTGEDDQRSDGEIDPAMRRKKKKRR
jgi:tetratricopeptide (TPR) repeat protein